MVINAYIYNEYTYFFNDYRDINRQYILGVVKLFLDKDILRIYLFHRGSHKNILVQLLSTVVTGFFLGMLLNI